MVRAGQASSGAKNHRSREQHNKSGREQEGSHVRTKWRRGRDIHKRWNSIGYDTAVVGLQVTQPFLKSLPARDAIQQKLTEQYNYPKTGVRSGFRVWGLRVLAFRGKR